MITCKKNSKLSAADRARLEYLRGKQRLRWFISSCSDDDLIAVILQCPTVLHKRRDEARLKASGWFKD